MRKYLFRGKAIYEKRCDFGEKIKRGQWVFGCLLHDVDIKNDVDRYLIAFFVHTGAGCMECGVPVMEYVEVDPKTVGQFTEFTDKIDVKIFEDDVIFIPREAGVFKRDVIGLVTYNNGAYWVIGLDNAFGIGLNMLNTKLTQVIGNKHDNQEFFIGKKE